MKGASTTTLITRSMAQLIGIPATLAIAFTGCVHADYQQTLAAKGADAYTPTSAIITIETEDLDESFSRAALVSAPALSDQEVMIDLQSRMDSTNNLEQAAANLDPQAVADVLSDVQVASVDTEAATEELPAVEETATADSSEDAASDQSATIASR